MAQVGQVVQLRVQSTSTLGGGRTALQSGLVGRVCAKTPFGFCCVQFVGVGCRRVHEDKLILAPSGTIGPDCTIPCTNGTLG